MLEKKPVSGKNVEVTFRMPPIDGAVELYLCGDFNDWHKSAMPLTQEADGSWVTSLLLESGKSFRFRYYDNQGRWHNDWEADAYVPNIYGSEDSVVDLAAPLRSTPPEPARRGQSQGRSVAHGHQNNRRSAQPGRSSRGRSGGGKRHPRGH